MGIFEQFPYSNFHNANLDNVLNNSNQALRDAANAVHIAGEAKDIAEGLTDDVATALQEAEAASTAAASAEATAAQAQADAEVASGLAQDAYDLASAADSAAANALSIANTASSNASAAVSTANDAAQDAANATSTANDAAQDAADAVTTANAANTNASAAVNTANTASTNASAAVSTANAALDAVNNIPDASATLRGLINTATQILRGIKTFDSDTIIISNGDSRDTHNYSQIQFNDKTFSSSPDTSSGTRAGYITCIRDNVGSSLGNLIQFLIRSPLAGGTGYTGYYDAFRLPIPSAGKTANNWYDILTTKEPVTVAQGGTGATTVSGARDNLQVQPSYTWNLSSGVATSFNTPSNSRHLVVVVGTAVGRDGVFLVRATSTGSVAVTDVYKGASLSHTQTTNTFTITASGGGATIMFITLYGGLVTKN